MGIVGQHRVHWEVTVAASLQETSNSSVVRTHSGTYRSRWWLPVLMLAMIGLPQSVKAEDSPTLLAMMGETTFNRYCSNCHGSDAKGEGDISKYLKIRPADLTLIRQRSKGDFPYDEVKSQIDGRKKVPGHGMREMPVWGDVFQTLPQLTPTDEAGEERAQRKIRELLLYLESIQE